LADIIGHCTVLKSHVWRAPPGRRIIPARAVCITILQDRGDEPFVDDRGMGRGTVSGTVPLLLHFIEIRPHRPNDLLPTGLSPDPDATGLPPAPPLSGAPPWSLLSFGLLQIFEFRHSHRRVPDPALLTFCSPQLCELRR
jgi:hypothetical protein